MSYLSHVKLNSYTCIYGYHAVKHAIGPFQGYICDQKSGKFHFSMATAPGAYMLSTSFLLIIVLPVGVKTYRSLEIKFLIKVKNKVHVTIGHVCDFAQNWTLH